MAKQVKNENVSLGVLDELNSLIQETVELESQNRDTGGKQYSYLRLLGNSANDPIMKKGKPEYIEGAETGCWVVPSHKINLGKEVDITILGMFKVYEDTVPGQKKDPKSKQEPMPQVVGYWLPSDAENIPVEGLFDRPYVDKAGVVHTLRPVHWVFVHLHKYPEIEDALITFRRKGNGIYKELQKLIVKTASSCTELRLTLSHQEIEATGWERDYLYPAFEIKGRNYDIVDGKIKLVSGRIKAEELASIIKRSHAMQVDYAGQKMVSKKTNLAAIVSSASTAIEDMQDDDGSPIPF